MKKYIFIFSLIILYSGNVFQQTVNIPLIATDGSCNIAIAVGLDLTAANCIDPQLGEVNLPLPSAGVFDIRFDLEPYGCPYTSTARDYRAPGGPPVFPFTGIVQHTLSWQRSASGLSVDISYDLPWGATMTIVDIFGGIFLNLGPLVGQGTATIPGTCPLSSAILTMQYVYIGGDPVAGPVFCMYPDSIDFGEVAVGQVDTLSVLVTNPGYLNDLIITDVVSSSPAFAIQPDSFPLVIAPLSSQTFDIIYHGVIGLHNDKIIFSHNAPGSPTELYVCSKTPNVSVDSVYSSQVYTFDINQDGYKEFIISCTHTNYQCRIYAFDRDGILLQGFPFQLPKNLVDPPRISMYDNDKLIAAYEYDDKAYFLGINSSGELTIPESEVTGVNAMSAKEPAVADITGDGVSDLIFLYSHAAYNSSTLVLYNPVTQQVIQKFFLNYSQVGPAIGDIDGDGINDVIQETGMFWDANVTIWVFKGDGTIISDYPKTITGSTIFAGVHLADFVGDYRPEIILQLSDYVLPPIEYLKILSPDGEEILTRTFNPVQWGGIPFTAVCKTDETSSPVNSPILVLGRGKHLYYIDVINNNIESVFLDKVPGDLKVFRSVTKGPSGSGLITVAVQTSSGLSTVNVIDQNLQIVRQIDFESVLDVQVCDIENNGYLDIISTRKNSSNTYTITVTSDFCQYDPDKVEWPLYRHDPGMTCNYDYHHGFVSVELKSFNVYILGNSVELNWTTATETNNSGFEIQKEVGSKHSAVSNWEKIGFVPGFGTTTKPKSYSFTDEDITTGIYKYRLKQIDFDGSFTYSNEIEIQVDFTPKEFVLYQNYPNPFNPTTTIKYTIPEVASGFSLGKVTLKAYDVLGKEITTLVNEYEQPGIYEVEFDASTLASGIYFYELKTGSYSSIKKMILLK